MKRTVHGWTALALAGLVASAIVLASCSQKSTGVVEPSNADAGLAPLVEPGPHAQPIRGAYIVVFKSDAIERTAVLLNSCDSATRLSPSAAAMM